MSPTKCRHCRRKHISTQDSKLLCFTGTSTRMVAMGAVMSCGLSRVGKHITPQLPLFESLDEGTSYS